MHLIDAAGLADGVRYLSVRHEQVAAFMADGYARASGGIGVCLASCSPGAANLAIGVHNAHAESIPSKTLSIEFGPGHPCQHSVAGSDQDAATSGPSSARGAGGAVYLWAVLGAGPFRFRVGVLTAAQPVASDCARGEHPDAGREQAHERRHPGG
jgi:hypothetical protein